MILASSVGSNEGGAGILEISVSSVGNDDDIDNSSNNFSSDLTTQHARFIDCHEGQWLSFLCASTFDLNLLLLLPLLCMFS